MNNIIELPRTKNKKIQEAINVFSQDNFDIALIEFTKLIDEGCDEAFSFVGAIYEFGGNNVDRDYDKARFYYEQSIERYGAVVAYHGLIRMYYYGLGVNKDCCKALEYCNILVEDKDDVYANFLIGKMYMDGCCVDKDLKAAKKYFSKAWEKGYVFGLTYLGFLEQQRGSYIKGLLLRVKAGIMCYFMARKNINDPRIREI